MCGEHFNCNYQHVPTFGSSPRVWGTLIPEPSSDAENRFIPTCVGNTIPLYQRQHLQPVHPHVCGEHKVRLGMIGRLNGSSPRVWGTRKERQYIVTEPRFIPTCVGNTPGTGFGHWFRSVHPHVCGEHHAVPGLLYFTNGSSPRVWGTRGPETGRPGSGRFIPTCVGNTGLFLSGFREVTVHPHVCGEHFCVFGRRGSGAGSSPRVWGTRYKPSAQYLHVRFIPTCVGNTFAIVTFS